MTRRGVRNDEGLAFPLSLRGSVRNRGNPVFGNEAHWIASACRLAMTWRGVRNDEERRIAMTRGWHFRCHCEVPQGTALDCFGVPPRNDEERRIAMTEGLACAMTRSKHFRCHCGVPRGNRGNPVFDNERHWIASACRLAMTEGQAG